MARFRKASADEARSRRDKHVRKALGGSEAVIKGFRSPPSWDPQKRSARFTMSSESVDRYGDIVVQSGIDIGNFVGNPQGLLFHNSRSWPCGQWSDIQKVLNGRPKRTEGTLTLLPEGTDPDVDRAAAHVAVGSIRTVSIGFVPNWDEVELILDDEEEWVTGLKFNESELVECSLVPIPAQPDALVKFAEGLPLARDIIEHVLDNYAKSPEGLLLPMDEYRAKHLDLISNRTIHVIRGLLPDAEPKTAEPKALELKATTDEEARSFNGAAVILNPAIKANQEEEPAKTWLECTGEVISGWIVSSGEFKGVFALAVEFSDKSGTPLGMWRGLAADRVLLAKSAPASKEAPAPATAIEPAAETERTAAETVVAPAPAPAVKDITITFNVDTTDAEKKVNAFTKLIEGATAQLDRLLGRAPKEERQEPVIVPKDETAVVPATPAAPPTPEELAAVKDAAAERLKELSGLLAA